MGFDVLWNCDTLNEPDHPGTTMFEASCILAAIAMRTSNIRIGTLVANLILRNPAVGRQSEAPLDVKQRAGC